MNCTVRAYCGDVESRCRKTATEFISAQFPFGAKHTAMCEGHLKRLVADRGISFTRMTDDQEIAFEVMYG